METTLHRASERGHANHGWLDSYHSFSFANYFNPDRIHFGALRVLNDDTVAPGYGFGKHPHDNMEIVSIPLKGDLHHQDSTGRDKIIKQGDVQIMSAGSGITHSEKNANSDQEVKFLQIWVFPKEKNIEPRYDQKTFPVENRINNWQTVVAPDDPGAVWINQKAWFTLGKWSANYTQSYSLHAPHNGVYIFIISGEVEAGGNTLSHRDALGVWDTATIQLKALSEAEILVIEVPMNFN